MLFRSKATFGTFAIGMMALAGVPFLFSGFWSKEAILHAAHVWEFSHLPLYAGLCAVVLTAFYMTRLYILTFRGKSRLSHEAEHHLHESPPSMIAPLAVLAVLSIVGFLFVLMTWYGVNFILGRGLHSYGSGSGGMIWILYYLAAEFIFLAYFLKRLKRS